MFGENFKMISILNKEIKFDKKDHREISVSWLSILAKESRHPL